MGEIRSKLLPVFLEEAQNNLVTIRRALEQLCSGSGDCAETLEVAFRAVHTTKGTAALVHLENVQQLGAALEEVLEALSQCRKTPDATQCQVLQQAATALDDMVRTVREGRPESESPAAEKIGHLTHRLRSVTGSLRKFPDNPHAGIPIQNENPDQLLDEMNSFYLRASERDDLDHPAFCCCCFSIGAKDYHLKMDQLVEICELPDIVPLPLAPGHVEGLTHLRGTVVPVINLAVLENNSASIHGEKRLIVAEHHGEHLGFLAEGMPQLATQTRGQEIDIPSFIHQYQVKLK